MVKYVPIPKHRFRMMQYAYNVLTEDDNAFNRTNKTNQNKTKKSLITVE